MDTAAASEEKPVSFDASTLAKAAASSLAEDITHEVLLAVDPTAVHLGGRTQAHDHEIFSGADWVETKSGWYKHRGKSKGLPNADRLFFSSVNWSAKCLTVHTLAAVAIVPLRAEDIVVLKESGSVTFEYEVDHIFLIPARELNSRSIVHGRGHSSVELDWARPYRIDGSNALTLESLHHIVAAGRFMGFAAS